MTRHEWCGAKVRAATCDRLPFRMSPVRRTLDGEADFSLI